LLQPLEQFCIISALRNGSRYQDTNGRNWESSLKTRVNSGEWLYIDTYYIRIVFAKLILSEKVEYPDLWVVLYLKIHIFS